MKPLIKKEEQPEEQPKEQSKEQEYLEGWKRARADLENTKKRMAESHVQQRVAITRDIVESLLSLADNFRSLVEHAPKEQDAWAQGVVHVARQFDQTLEGFGVTMIGDTEGIFDPVIHEAVEEVESKENPGTVVALVQVGYKIGDTVIRPAKLKVTAELSSRPVSRDPDHPAAVVSGSSPE